MMTNNNIDTRLSYIQTELQSIKHSIELNRIDSSFAMTWIDLIKNKLASIKSSISTNDFLTKYLNNKYKIDYKECNDVYVYKDVTSSIISKDIKSINIYIHQIKDNRYINVANYSITKEQYKGTVIDYFKQYISKTYNIPNPTIVTLTINNQTYYDFIQ